MRIDKVIIGYGRMRIIVSFDPDETTYTDIKSASLAMERYPDLGIHSCINSKGPTFGCVIEETSLPHLLEHMIISEQSSMARDKGVEDVTFVGVTHWVDEGRGVAEVQVSFIDDLDATLALSKSFQSLEAIVSAAS